MQDNKNTKNNALKEEELKHQKTNTACFAAGTLVHTAHGLVPIEQLKVGDKVLSKAADGSGELVYKAILKTLVTDNVPIFLMEFVPYVDPTLPMDERINLRRALKKKLKPEPLFVTENHPFWTTTRGWLKAEQLTTQDPMITKDGQKFFSRAGGGLMINIKE